MKTSLLNIQNPGYNSNRRLGGFDNFHMVFKHKNLSEEKMLELQEQAITGHYFRPRCIFKYIRRSIVR